MTDGGGGGGGRRALPPSSPASGGEFLLQLLQRPPQQQPQTQNPPSMNPPWMDSTHLPSPNNTPWGLAGLPPPPNLAGNHHHPPMLADDFHRLGLLGGNGRLAPPPQQEQLMFGSMPSDFRNHQGLGASASSNIWGELHSHGGVVARQQQQQQQSPQRNVQPRASPMSAPPPGFPRKPKGIDQLGPIGARRESKGNVDKEEDGWNKLNHLGYQGNGSSALRLSGQLDHPGLPGGSKMRSVPGSDVEQSLATLHSQVVEQDRGRSFGVHENRPRDDANGSNHQMNGRRHWQDDLSEQLMDSVRLSNGLAKNIGKHDSDSYDKDFRSNKSRELQPPGRRMRNNRRVVDCRNDINNMNVPFLAIYESLVPAEEEKAKQKQLLMSLEKLVNKEWPRAQLYLYGSCANSFGVSNSDIDVCLSIEDEGISKSEILLKLADILQEDNLQNVQALTRARVPIVKLMDPVTGISCDICINNALAVVNTKLLRDYAQIDGRLRQLAYLVKHWAKSRGVNVTYQGTLSSYAYVLMCIHFLQQRQPAILPCLQGMEATYVVTVEDIECAYFDEVQNICDFGAWNKETIAQLLWAFFDYWAFRHDYANAVISVRTGSIISKRDKDWTRRIGNDRHLICIEDPFETSHDLGRVVDKHSIKILREEFERAANIMQYDPDPCTSLFIPYVPDPPCP